MVAINTTIVNVALPMITTDLGFSGKSAVWIVDSYLIPYAGLLMPAGRLGDFASRRRLFLWGTMLFVCASIGCSLAVKAPWFIAMRALQGVSAALVSPLALSLAASLFDKPLLRANALGLLNFMNIGGGSLALFIGGILVAALGWRWVFLAQVPFGVTVFVLGWLSIPITARSEMAPRLDFKCVLTLFVPLAALRFLRIHQFRSACIIQFIFAGVISGWRFITSLYLQSILDYTPLEVGFSFLPATVIAACLTLKLSGKLISHLGIRLPLAGGLIFSAVGLALFAMNPIGRNFAAGILPGMLLIGIGIGIVATPLLFAATSSLPANHAGTASGIFSTIAYIGAALGVAVLGSVTTGHSSALTAPDRFRVAFSLGALLMLAAPATLSQRATLTHRSLLGGVTPIRPDTLGVVDSMIATSTQNQDTN